MKKTTLEHLVQHCDGWLEPERFQDYCANGVQVEGPAQVGHLATAVTASHDAITQAMAMDADVLLVHHGLFWGKTHQTLTGVAYQRCRLLMKGSMALLAYHLPLDAHPEFGNNALLGTLLDFEVMGDLPFLKPNIGLWGRCEPQTAAAMSARLTRVLGRKPMVLSGGDHVIKTIAWCSGAAQDALFQAKACGADAFISGEVSEQTYHMARELGVHYFAAGHHATERYGVQALGKKLAEVHQIKHTYIELNNPV